MNKTHKKLLPINSKISISDMTKSQYHVLKSYYSYAVIDGKWSILETAVDKHRVGDCKSCEGIINHLNNQVEDKEMKEE